MSSDILGDKPKSLFKLEQELAALTAATGAKKEEPSTSSTTTYIYIGIAVCVISVLLYYAYSQFAGAESESEPEDKPQPREKPDDQVVMNFNLAEAIEHLKQKQNQIMQRLSEDTGL